MDSSSKPAGNFCIVVTGLPAGGKTTIGREIAQRLDIPFLDKDDYLEQLYDERGTGDRAWRTRLSLESNDLFQEDAVTHPQAVLVSHWRPKWSDGPSGTPTAWLESSYQQVLELFCDCPVETAAQRFANRQRHAGHLDKNRELSDITKSLTRYRAELPIGIGCLIVVDSSGKVDLSQTISDIQMALRAGGSKNE